MPDDTSSPSPRSLRGEQHAVGLADAGRGAEEDLQPAAPALGVLALDSGEQSVRVGRCSPLWPAV